MTRARAKRQEEAAVQTQKERESGAQPTTLLEDSDQIEHQVQTDPNMDYSNEPQTQVNVEENKEDNPQGSRTRISIEENYMDELLQTLDVQTQKERESGAQPTTLLDDSDQIEHQVQTDPNMDYSNEPQTQVNVKENKEDNPQGSQTRISIEEDYRDDLLQTLDDKLFVPSCNKQTLTKREKREQRVQYQQKQKDSQTQ